MAFPGPGAQIYTNEAGEVLGWDYPSHDDPYDDYDRDYSAEEAAGEDAYELGYDHARNGQEAQPCMVDPRLEDTYRDGFTDGVATNESENACTS